MYPELKKLEQIAQDYRDFCMVNQIDEGIHTLRGEDVEHFSLKKEGTTIEIYNQNNYDQFTLTLDDKVEVKLGYNEINLPMSCSSTYINELVESANNYLREHLVMIPRNESKLSA